MSVVDSTAKITPKSILRYRPIDGEASSPKSQALATDSHPPVARASRLLNTAMETEDTTSSHDVRSREEPQGKVTRAITNPLRPFLVPSQAGKLRQDLTRIKPKAQTKAPKQSRSFVFYLLMGMSAMLVLWIVYTLVAGWAATWENDLKYGRPRTFQTDVRVGQNNDQTGLPSHFIAINLNRNIEVIEFPGGDASQARTFAGPQLYGVNDDLVPVTLTFADLNNDKKLDMVINFQNQHMVYINDGKSFRLPLATEQAEIEQALQRLGMQ